MKKKFDGNYTSNIVQDLEVAPNKVAVVRPLTSHHENYQT